MASPSFIHEEIARLTREYEAARTAYTRDASDPMGWFQIRDSNMARRFALDKLLAEARQTFPEEDPEGFAILPAVRKTWAYAFRTTDEDGAPVWVMRSALDRNWTITASVNRPAPWDDVCEEWRAAVERAWQARRLRHA